MIFLDGFPTVNRSCVRHKNRVLCKARGHGGGIAVVIETHALGDLEA
jgi:hypothetical protein